MSWRDAEWLQFGMDVLKEMLDVQPQLQRQMIHFLLDEGFWDSAKLSPDAAYARWRSCMNPGKPDFFKVSELWALMKRFQRYELLYAMCDDLGFERPCQIPVARRRAEIEHKLVELRAMVAEREAELKDALTHIDPATAPPRPVTPLRVHPRMREPGARFAVDDEGHGEGGI